MAAPGRKQHLTKLYWIAPSTTKKITPGKAWGLPHLFTPLTVLATKSANESTFIAWLTDSRGIPSCWIISACRLGCISSLLFLN